MNRSETAEREVPSSLAGIKEQRLPKMKEKKKESQKGRKVNFTERE